ncbi:hypothetical protein I3760_01G145200 [Carya illinoinensis]|nr:hypothetical protein I3760_01G145200 [Carya illinoinensis]
MEYSTLELNVISAEDIKYVKYLFSRMDVYVVVSLSGSGNKQKTKTNVDRDGGTSPSWNFPMKFIINDSAAPKNLLTLEFKLRCGRSLGGNKDIGEVYVPIIELLNSAGDTNIQFVSYQLTRPSGKPKGVLNFSYKFSGNVAAGEPLKPKAMTPELVAAYPAASVAEPSAPPYDGLYPESAPPPPHPEGYLYAPPAPPYQPYGPPPPPGYGYPPPPGYGYPPPPGYGYPTVQKPVPKKNKFGMVLGARRVARRNAWRLLIGDFSV